MARILDIYLQRLLNVENYGFRSKKRNKKLAKLSEKHMFKTIMKTFAQFESIT